MRIILLAFFVLMGSNLVINTIDKADKIQQEKMHQLCTIDPTLCQQLNHEKQQQPK